MKKFDKTLWVIVMLLFFFLFLTSCKDVVYYSDLEEYQKWCEENPVVKATYKMHDLYINTETGAAYAAYPPFFEKNDTLYASRIATFKGFLEWKRQQEKNKEWKRRVHYIGW